MNNKEKSDIEKLLQSIPDEFRVFEDKINPKVIDEYYEIAKYLEDENQPEIEQKQDKWKELKSLKDVKLLLVYLSKQGSVESYRKIEEIIKSGKPEILDFSYVALKIALLNLENELTDDSIGFISSPSGGKWNKLRYYFVVKSQDQITQDRELKITKELESICAKNDSEVEEIENHGKFIKVQILVSINCAFVNIVNPLTSKCPFLDEEYICVNLEKPTNEFVERWMNDEFD